MRPARSRIVHTTRRRTNGMSLSQKDEPFVRAGMGVPCSWSSADPMVSGCPYPGVRIPCEAPGTTSQRAASLRAAAGKGSPGRLNLMVKDRLTARYTEPANEADQGRSQNGEQVGPTLRSGGGDTRDPCRVIDPNLPRAHLPLSQQGKPHALRPHGTDTRPRGRATAQGVEDVGESEGRPVTGRIGPSMSRRGYPTRKGAHFRRVSAETAHLRRPHHGGR